MLSPESCDEVKCPWTQLWEPPNLSDLTVELLEANPREYHRVLEYLLRYSRIDKSKIKEKLNEKPYETWYSNHLFALSRLVGTLNPNAQDRTKYLVGSFYGSRNRCGIPQDLAMNLLKMMINSGGDITSKDYYEKNVLEYLKDGASGSLFYRIENDKYTRFVEMIFSKSSCTVTEEYEEGIPPEYEEGIPPENK